MTSASVLRALREHWLTLVAGALVGLLVAGAAAWLTPRTYSASASVYVSSVDASAGGDAFTGTLLVPQRVASYRQLLTSGIVLDPVQAALGVPVTPGNVAAVSQSDSATFTASVTSGDPRRAAAVADAVADRFSVVVGDLERPNGPAGPAGVGAVVVDRADVPAAATSPRVPVFLMAGLVVGLVAALATVLVRAATDTSVRTAAALRSAVGGVSLGTLPVFRSAPGDAFAAAAREVRTRLRLAVEDDPARVLLLTAAEAGEGTTTTVRALAGAFARSSRVVVVDANLRRPGLVEGGGDGLAQVLAGTVPLDGAIRRDGDGKGVDVVPAGALPDDPGDLLTGGATAGVLDRLRADYDVILVDTPALGENADAAVVARHVDGVIVVCRAGRTPRASTASAAATLRSSGARVVGSVLTRAAPGAVTDDALVLGERAGGPVDVTREAWAPAGPGEDLAPTPGRAGHEVRRAGVER